MTSELCRMTGGSILMGIEVKWLVVSWPSVTKVGHSILRGMNVEHDKIIALYYLQEGRVQSGIKS